MHPRYTSIDVCTSINSGFKEMFSLADNIFFK